MDGMLFDAAVDWDRQLHNYSGIPTNLLPIELYNFDKKGWGEEVIYQDISEWLKPEFDHPCIDFDFILEKTKEWIRNE